MAFKTVSPGGAVVLACLATMGLGLILQIVGVATTGWMTHEEDYGGTKVSLNVGLFKMELMGVTVSLPADGTCSSGESKLRAAQALSIIAILISVAYLVFAVMDKAKQMVPIPPLGGALLFLLAVFSLTTWAIVLGVYFKDPCGGDSAKDGGANLGYSFFLYLFGSLMSTGACAVHLEMRSIKGNAAQSFQDTQLVGKFVPDSETGYKMQG